MTSITISLPDSAIEFLDERVSNGEVASADEYLARLIEEKRLRAAKKRIDRLLIEGLESGEGEVVTDEWWEQRRRRLRSECEQSHEPS